MILIPAFELGFWNAWILVIPILIISFSDMRVTSIRESGRAGDFKLTKKENRLTYLVFLPMIVSYVYAVFLPLQLDTTWLYIGLIIYMIGIIIAIVAPINGP